MRRAVAIVAGLALAGGTAHAMPDDPRSPTTAPPVEQTPTVEPPLDDVPPPPVEAPAEAPQPEEQPPAEVEAPRGKFVGITGTVTDANTGEPIADIVIEVVDGDHVLTDRKGRFRVALPDGTYTLRIGGDLYQRRRVRGVVVRRGATTVDVKLSEDEIEEIVVIAPPDNASDAVQVVKRRKRATVSDAISAEQISRSPDSSAGDAAKRMVGATIQDGRYVVIRGLGGRYSLTLLNGVPLPSPDPDVPAAPLDLFPAALLSNLTVTKTFSPDSPGNFAGGSLSIETRSFPAKFTFKVRSGLAANTVSSFKGYNAYEGGSLDRLGYDDGTRGLPSAIPPDKLAGDPNLPPEQTSAQARGFRNIWALDEATAGPNASLGATLGNTITFRKHKLGYFSNVAYGHGYTHRTAHIARVGEPDGNGGYLPSTLQLDDDQGTRQASVSGLLTAGWMPSAAHQVNLVTLYTHSADITGSIVTGTDNSTAQIERTRLRFLEREMSFGQLVGESGFGGGKAIVGWQLNLARVSQSEPDTRDLRRVKAPDGRLAIDSGSGSSERLFANLGDTSGGGGFDVTLPFEAFKLKSGASVLHSARQFQARRFHFDVYGDDVFLEPEQAFDPAGAGTSMFISESTLPTDGYKANRTITSAYLMADVMKWDPLRVVAGARFERSSLDVGLDSDIDLMTEPTEPTSLADNSILPAINVVYGLTRITNLRAAYATTVARPNFREIAPALYYDYVRRRAIGGNSMLQETTIHNGDLRWETFVGDTELIAASLFYKRFIDPIEQVVSDAGDGQNVGFENAAGASTYGLELEARLSLGRIADVLAPFSVGGNLAIIRSTIDLMGAERALQGQSPYVANVDLGYTGSKGTTVNVLYNAFGRRIEEVGTGGVGNVYEEPFHRVDVTVSQKLPHNLKLKLAGANLLDQRVVRRQDGVEIFAYPLGMTFVGSLEMSLE